MERQSEYQQLITLVKDNEIQGNRIRSEGVQDNVRRRIEREHCNTDEKRSNQIVYSDIHDKESKRKMKKNTECESVEQIDCRLPLQNARFKRGQTNSQTWRLEHFTGYLLRISPPISPNIITSIPNIRIPEQPLRIKSNAIRNETLINMLCNRNEANYAPNKNENRDQNNQQRRLHFLLHQNKEYLKNMTQKVINILKYFGFTMNTEKSESETNQTVIFLGQEWNLANVTVKINSKKRLLLLHDLYNMRRWIKTGTEITVMQTAKLIEKLNYLRQQFQETSLFLNIMDHQKAQAARLRGWNTQNIMNKTAIPDINWWIAKLRANIPTQLIQILPQMIMIKDAAPNSCGLTIENVLEIIVSAHGT
ncbi:MAG: hypothetical protein EZS28_011437 [Streblomastix strix]|uniref:Reverse transcriptase domain-containing protein n=1 Tax=Streblomastix strix TaxID=222440 RepID=A0A5J4WDM2_9EUKA|nr:MAG: hypothetical protein EZS28_011437 [Streblomastix strix]